MNCVVATISLVKWSHQNEPAVGHEVVIANAEARGKSGDRNHPFGSRAKQETSELRDLSLELLDRF